MALTRRTFVQRAAGATAAAPFAAAALGARVPVIAAAAKNWSDPTAWPNLRVPGPNDIAEVTGSIVVDVSTTVAGVTVTEGSLLTFDPDKHLVLESSGNIVVYGTMVMRPTASASHTIKFINVDESKFVGGGIEILASDVGLWVTDMGVLDAVGTTKRGWNRTGDDATWYSTDELISTPVTPGDYTNFKAFTKGSAVPTSPQGFKAEILNLTRNVKISGTPSGRAHFMFLHSMVPQTIKNVEVSHMGPRQNDEGVLGRYPVHFHHGGDGTRGSLVESVVVRHSGNRAFVPHAAHGVTLRDCVAYDIMNAPYWWDLPTGSVLDTTDLTDDTLWEDCVAALVHPNDPIRGWYLHGFMMGSGSGNVARGLVATGIGGTKNAAGFQWPSMGNGRPNLWVFEDCVAHNNKANGIFTWQNDPNRHVVERFLAYNLGISGIVHGAYTNRYLYKDIEVYDCVVGVDIHAKSSEEDPRLTFENVFVYNASGAAVQISKSNSDNEGKPLFTGGLLTSLHVNNASNNGTLSGEYHFIDTGLTADDVTIVEATPGTIIYVEQQNDAWEINDIGEVTVVDGGGTTTTTQPPGSTTTTQPPGSTTTTQPPGSTTTTQPPGSTTTTSRPPDSTTTTQQPPTSTTRPTRRGRPAPRDGVVEDGRGSEVPGTGETRSGFLGRLLNPFEVGSERSGAYGLTGTTAALSAAAGGTPTVGLVSQIGALSQPVPVVASAVGAGAVLLIKRRMLMAEAEVAEELALLDD